MLDGEEQPSQSRGLPPSALGPDLEFARPAPGGMKNSCLFDWLTEVVDESTFWPLCSPDRTDTSAADTAPLPLTADDKSFWRALIFPADPQSA